jgi:translocation and assembly module TamB
MSEATPPPPPPSPATGAAGRRRLVRVLGSPWVRWPAGLIAGVLTLVMAVALALAALLGTAAGSAWLLAQVPGVQLEAPRGALASGAFEAARLRWSDGQAVLDVEQLRWHGLRLRWRPHAQAWVGVDVDTLAAQRVAWAAPPGEPAPAPDSLMLPLQLRVAALRIATLEVAGLPALAEVQAAFELGADGGQRHRLARLALRVADARVQAQGEVGTGDGLPLALSAQLSDARQPDPAWRAELDLRGPLQRIEASARIDSLSPPATLHAQATLAPWAAWPLAALRVEARDFDLAVLDRRAPRTRLSGHADLHRAGPDAPIEATLALRNALPGRWSDARLPLRRLDARLRGHPDARDTVELPAFDAVLADADRDAGRWQGSGRWHGHTLRLDTTLHALRTAALDARAPALTLGGALALHAAGLPAPDGRAPPAGARSLAAELRLTGQALALPAAPPLRLDGGVAVQTERGGWAIALRGLRAEAGDTRAQLDADAHRDAAGGWTLASHGALLRFDPRPWWTAAAGHPFWRAEQRWSARWQVELAAPALAVAQPAQPDLLARLAALRGQAEVQVDDSRVAGVATRATLHWQHRAGAAAQARVDAGLGGNRLQLSTADDPAGATWQAEVDAPALAALAPLAQAWPALAAQWPRAGTLHASARVWGDWPELRTEGQARVDGLRAAALDLGRGQLQWALAPAPSLAALRADAPLRIEFSAEHLVRDGLRLPQLAARIDGSPGAHRLALDARSTLRPPAWADAWLPAGAASQGSRLTLHGDGAWAAAADGGGRWRLQLAELRLAALAATPAGAPAGADGTGWLRAAGLVIDAELGAGGAPRALRVEPGRAQILDAGLRWQRLDWAAAAAGQPPVFAVEAELEAFDVAAALRRLQPDFGWGGDLRVGATLRWQQAAAVAAELVVERQRGDLALTVDGLPRPFGLSDLRLSATLDNGTWVFAQGLAGTHLGVLAGAQRLRASPGAAWPEAQAPLDGVVELRVADLGVWSPWLPPGWRPGGQMHAQAALAGTWGDPQYRGRLDAQGLALRHLLHGVDLREGTLALALEGEHTRIETLRLRGGDGTLAITGSARLGAAPRAQLQLVAERFQALGRVDRRAIVSGRADATLEPDALRVAGRLGVDRGLFDFGQADAPVLDADVRVVPRGEPRDAAPRAPPPPRLRELDLQLALDLGPDLRLRGRGLDTRLAGQLRLTTPARRPTLTGTVRAVDGSYQAYGQRLRIERGNLSFTGEVDNPSLDILALRPHLDVDVGVEIGGTARAPRVRLYSDPAMPDAEKLSWLLLGREPAGLGQADTALLQSLALALLAGEQPGLDAGLMRALGLDALAIAQVGEGTLRDTVVTVGRQLGRRWFVAYERGVNATAGSWQLIYRAAQRFTVRAQTGAASALDLIWTWRWD